MFQFDRKCFLLSLVLLSLLIYIALFVSDQFVRPFFGDVLVVGWLYLFLKSFIKMQNSKIAHSVLFFACVIEVAQFYNLVAILGLQHIEVARIIIGSTFDWLDILAYAMGWASILLIEHYRFKLYKK